MTATNATVASFPSAQGRKPLRRARIRCVTGALGESALPARTIGVAEFALNIIVGGMYLFVGVFLLVVAIPKVTMGPLLVVLAGTGLLALSMHYFVRAASFFRHSPSKSPECTP